MMALPANLHFSWQNDLKIRSKSVERTLEPLVKEVSALVHFRGPSNRLKGRSRKAEVLVDLISKAIQSFLERGSEIIKEARELKQEMMAALDDVKTTGEDMVDATSVFSRDPCSATKREEVIKAAKALLSAVTRLLILADMIDIYTLLESLKIVERNVEAIKASQNQQELNQNYEEYGQNVMGLIDLAGMRQIDLIDPGRRDEIAAARATLKKNNLMLLTTSKTYVRHPELQAAQSNREFAIKSVCDAVKLIHGATQDSGDIHPLFVEKPGDLAALIHEFENNILMDHYTYDDSMARRPLEDALEDIISSAAVLADSSCTRQENRENIFEQCNQAKTLLQVLLREYARNAGRREVSESLHHSRTNMIDCIERLAHHMDRAVVDHISDTFLDASMPLQILVAAAREGNEARVEVLSVAFQEHANTLEEVANLACSMCYNEEKAKLVRTAVHEMKQLCTQVINAARVLSARPQSKVAQENMDVFQDAWMLSVRLLIESVDDCIKIDDFLMVTENHIHRDVEACIHGVQCKNSETVCNKAMTICGRSDRICQVVSAEIATHPPNSGYVDRVMQAITQFRDNIVPDFNRKVPDVEENLSSKPPSQFERFCQSARQVYEGVKDVRRAVILDRDQDGYESDVGDAFDDRRSRISRASSISDIGDQENIIQQRSAMDDGPQSDRAMMRLLPAEEREVIMQEMAGFYEEKKKFMREMTKWDDTANDLIVIAKRMCVIMMDMTDFTRGKGKLKTTMDVIQAARRISELGTQLDKIAKQIAAQCPECPSKRDLEAYLQRIALYCHQLNITSKVKADVQNVGGELVVSGLDSATSLIQAAKNLMNAVILVVKASYIASTKNKSVDNRPIVQWRMKAPNKKPLIQQEQAEENGLRRSARYQPNEPINELSEFDQPIGSSSV